MLFALTFLTSHINENSELFKATLVYKSQWVLYNHITIRFLRISKFDRSDGHKMRFVRMFTIQNLHIMITVGVSAY